MKLHRNTTKVLLLSVMLVGSVSLSAQDRQVYGTVFETLKGEKTPMAGVVVKVPGYSIGTQTDADGTYRLSVPESAKSIVFERKGYVNDTFSLKEGANNASTMLKTIKQLEEVEVTYRQKGNEVGLLGTRKTEIISEREFLKAACCNLSESFETTPSIDVSFTDAVSGYRQIQMLGLAGPYTLITRENIPDVRGLSAITGLTYTPGTWIEGMQLSKGTGSVVNGYESVAGQLNIELRKPFEAKEPKLFLNVYQNAQGRSEANAVYRHVFNKQLSSNLMVHASGRWREVDMNNDGFMDQPQSRQFLGLNRWMYHNPKGLEFQAGVKGVYFDQTGGQLGFRDGTEQVVGKPWGYRMNTKRIEGFAKIGKVFAQKKGTSTGLQLSGVHHEQEALYGKRNYNAEQNTFYANWIFQTILGNTNHNLKTGLSSIVDNYNEQFENSTFTRNEVVPGAFVEYGYNYLTKFNAIVGLRGDYHNLFGFFVTPRLHVRYAPFENTAIRASAGRAQRTANILAENIGYMATMRKFQIGSVDPSLPYGLNPEVAWNYGVNLTQKFRLNYRDGSFSADYYYTDFKNQIVVDVEDPAFVRFYNLTGTSFAHSLQGQFDYEPIVNFNVRLAYRWYDVRTTFGNSPLLTERPLIAKHRAFVNLGYETKNTWRVDYTLQWIGSKRLPVLFDNTGAYILSAESPSFFQMNAQISKTWNDKLEVYIGGENLTNYLQPSPIIGAAQPFGTTFDASMIWGPVMGRNIYVGARWKLQ
ncbi:MAG: TonB-dependent receptor [Chitinophagales bacterium]|nr:TonB-dependent receptor [Chitinophagaceae bacterium]MCB9064456.1 TonB-dependent receptor [Chitinophagales bacterium]